MGARMEGCGRSSALCCPNSPALVDVSCSGQRQDRASKCSVAAREKLILSWDAMGIPCG